MRDTHNLQSSMPPKTAMRDTHTGNAAAMRDTQAFNAGHPQFASLQYRQCGIPMRDTHNLSAAMRDTHDAIRTPKIRPATPAPC
jgi:hypothetical protein